MRHTLIIPNHVDVHTVNVFFHTLGWQTNPTIPDQPAHDQIEMAWKSPTGGHARLVTDQVIRILFIEDATQAEISASANLPAYSDDDILQQLGSLDVRMVLAGIRATAALRHPGLVVGLASLHHHQDEAVRAESQEALRQLMPSLAADGLAFLHEQQQRSGGVNPLWSSSIPLIDRRQILRWLIKNHDRNNVTGLIATLRAAFRDPDWEIQVGAVIACVRWHIKELVPLIKEWVPPHSSQHGPLRDDQDFLRAVRDIALVELSVIPSQQRPALWAHISSCLRGEATLQRDHLWAVIRSISEPIPTVTDLPEVRPDWCFIPAIEHFLGEKSLRSVTGPALWIAQQPLRHGNDWWLGTWEEAEAYVAANHLAIPTADIWECAARGSDARRFPWGCGLPTETIASPWGCIGYGQGYEWTIGENGPELRGGDRPLPCAQQKKPQANERARLRPVLIEQAAL